MANTDKGAQEARVLLSAFAAVTSKHPKAMVGSGGRLQGASANKQPFPVSQLKSRIKRTGREDAVIARAEKALKNKKTKRDKNLATDLPRLRATREWIQLNYPDKKHPVRKLFEGVLRK